MRDVYLLWSGVFAGRHYVGVASDLTKRPVDHNAGKSLHTSKYTPGRWKYSNGSGGAIPQECRIEMFA